MLKFVTRVLFVLFLASAAKAEEAPLYVGEEEVMSAVRKEFAEQGADSEFEIEAFGGQTSFSLPGAKKAKLLVSKLKYDETQNKFSCALEVFADGKAAAKTQIQGRYFPLKEVYVPARVIGKGEVIGTEDLKVIKVRSGRVKPNMVTEAEKLAGMEAKRSLKEGKLISEREIGEVVLIKKGNVITAVYKTGQMTITAQAVALEDGARGQKIEAENSKSRKKVYGVVIDADTIEISQ